MVRTGIALLVLAAPLGELRADLPRLGIFRSKKKDDTPASDKDKAVRVKGLLEALRSDPDEKKRLAAVEELSEFDPRTHVDVLPALVASVKQDPSAGVRASTAEAIGEMKPVNQAAGVALEQTLTGDPSESVRKAAQQALWQYHLNGYRSQGASTGLTQTAEPPLAKGKKPVPAVPVVATPVAATPVAMTKPVAKGGVYQQTAEPPLAKPKAKPVPDVVAPPVPTLNVPALPPAPMVPPPAP